jgi:hypothetical protein
MTPDQKPLAIWGGSLAAAVIIGWIVLDSRGGTLADLQTRADDLKHHYAELYPDNGMLIADATKKWKVVAEQQAAALQEAEAALVPPLPKAYCDTDLTTAAGQVRNDLIYIKQKAERGKIKLPSTLPFEDSLDGDSKVRGMQLAELYLYKNALDDCMDAGIRTIATVHAGKGGCDPYEKYAVFLCDIDIESTYEQAEQLLLDLVQKQNSKGYGIRAMSVEHTKSGVQRISLTFSLLTVNDPSWGLKPDPSATSPSGTPGSGGTRFGRMGG